MSAATASFVERLRRISPFRWRLEWAVLVVIAVAGVLSEQAREAREGDPYQVVNAGRPARATITAARNDAIDLGIRRGERLQEVRTYVDLEWEDDRGERRRIERWRLDPETAAALRIDPPTGRWPQFVQILYLERPETAPRPRFQTLGERGVTATVYQQRCRPWRHCRMVVLAPEVLSPSEVAAQNVDYVLDRAPHALMLGIVILLLLLGLRLTGVVYNRPSLE